ncbi:MAG: helix-turn-helix protein [Paenibacillus sp.]|nr:helix-turn-helix protein [Paenibacillus sp.]
MQFWLKQTTYKRKLFLFVLLMSIVPVILLGMFSSLFAAKMVQKEVDHNHQIILAQIQYQIDSFLQTLERNSLQLATNAVLEEAVKTNPQQNLSQIFAGIDTIQRQRSLSDIPYDVSLVFNQTGKVYSTRYGYINDTAFIYYDVVKKSTTKYNSAVVIPPNSNPGVNDLILLRPVPANYSDTADCTLVLHVSSDKLTGLFDRVQLGGNRQLLVIDDKGNIVMSSNTEELGARLTQSSELYRFWSQPDDHTDQITLNGVPYSPSVQKSSFNNWTYIAMTPLEDLTHQAKSIQLLTWGVVLFLSLLWVLVSLIGSNRLYYPIQRLLHKISNEPSKNTQGPTDGLQALDSFIQQMVKTNEKLKSELSEQLPYLKETVFQQMLRGEMSEQEIRRKTEHYGFPLQGNWFYVCLVDLDRYVVFQNEYRDKDRSLMMYALRKMIEEICEESFSCITLTPLPGQVAVIIGVDKTSDTTDREIIQIAEQFRMKVRELFHFSVTVSVSTARKEYRSISDAYQEATELLGYRLLLGHNVIISKDAIVPSVRQSGQSLVTWQKKIVKSLAMGDLAEAKEHLAQTINFVPQYVHNSETVLGLFAYMLGEIDILLQQWGQHSDTYYQIDLYKELYAMTSLQEVKGWFEETVFPTVIQVLEEANLPKQTKIVKQALLFIQENIESDLSLQQVAEALRVSPTQLSRFFKEETSSPFGDYLIHIRMEQAKEWLAHTEMPIKEIAERLRYTSVTNFNRIFKQITTMPPGQYRKSIRD